LNLLHDLFGDSATTKLLEIECRFSDDYLLGHAKRVGLAGEMTPQATINRLLPTVQHNFEFEADQIRDANFPGTYKISEFDQMGGNIAALAGFLDVAEDVARDILDADYLYVD